MTDLRQKSPCGQIIISLSNPNLEISNTSDILLIPQDGGFSLKN